MKILDIPTTLTDFPKEQMWVMDMINSILIEVMGSIAENERNKIRTRQREGIEAAHKKKVKFGRPEQPKPDNWDSVMLKVSSGMIRPVDAMKEMRISRSRYYYLCDRYNFKRNT